MRNDPSMFKGHLCFAPCLNDTIKL